MAKANRSREYAKKKHERILDKLSLFEEFQKDLMPKMQKMLMGGASAQDIVEFAASFAAARTVTVALTSTDEGRALAASKDIIDRAHGKAKETVETTHKFDNLDEEQLDALLISKMKEVGGDVESEDP